ncbi:aldo/keto reductase [Streptomyces samsunensis]|uniref:L-glyceraldehyde 3-phosphate reductase n=2 Tax=Streptomyces malaysiensis TaxID=92644 RepID=A0A2J7YP45_STRMQ|nr:MULTISPECIES: aldo/keto reductase [Streptomyces]MCM3809360.1 aldo/keto reductase [Streptomyces sp. DR7-3]NUH39765.1 aldo/keto reductase [Streptomyces samsunensis]PNG89800.1 L-glyceraldehyde 3-phosphate reductase [Streptomyces malaysiensis]QPI61278.1 aldo/keto reductase [Streptomyces solisilvae]UHH23041.1 aldo/keto reductase [Streptomyces sp. HNM0561]
MSEQYPHYEDVFKAADNRYDSLPYRRTGRSGLDLPAFSLGLWQKFGADYAYDTQRDIILHAFDLGISAIDNANRYGPPHRAAEQTFGRVLRRELAPYRHELILSSKAGGIFGPNPNLRGGSRKALLTSLELSLRDLGTDYIDIFYHHTPDETTPLEETAGALATAVKSGKALYVGISNYKPDRAEAIAQLLKAEGVPLLIHQPRYSLYDRSIDRNGLADLAVKEGFGLIVYSPLAQGLLTNKYLETIPDGARARNSDFLKPDQIDETYRQRTAQLNKLAEDRGQSLAQLALQWVLRNPAVTSALVGASSKEQLDHNLRALNGPEFTDEELAVIDEYGVHGTGQRG